MDSDREEELRQLEARAHAGAGLVGGWHFPHPWGLPDGPVLDEFGRAWQLPRDREGLQKMLNGYIRRHGLPSKAVDVVFGRHGRLNDLRVLIARGVAGERINIAVRAMKLGPMKPIRRHVTMRPGDTPDAQQRMWQFDDRHDEDTLRAVEVESERLRLLGYVD